MKPEIDMRPENVLDLAGNEFLMDVAPSEAQKAVGSLMQETFNGQLDKLRAAIKTAFKEIYTDGSEKEPSEEFITDFLRNKSYEVLPRLPGSHNNRRYTQYSAGRYQLANPVEKYILDMLVLEGVPENADPWRDPLKLLGISKPDSERDSFEVLKNLAYKYDGVILAEPVMVFRPRPYPLVYDGPHTPEFANIPFGDHVSELELHGRIEQRVDDNRTAILQVSMPMANLVKLLVSSS